MKIGKLRVELVNDPKLGQIFKISAQNKVTGKNTVSLFDIKQFKDGDAVYLRISKNTALLLADYIDQELNDETNWKDK